MKRRTNLFYTNLETNFLTFSNYAEHMTGAFLATNIKMFPSRFICMNIPKLSNEEVQNFIKDYLIAYYENKLACLRDWAINKEDTHPDKKLNYLGYLIDAILAYDESAEISYFSDVTEQDYNGTFTDIICTIDSSVSFGKGIMISKDNSTSNDAIEIDGLDSQFLYGWATSSKNNDLYFGPEEFKALKPKFDNNNEDANIQQLNVGIYYANSFASSIEYDENSSSLEELKFNIIIPLYDIVDISTAENETNIGDGYFPLDLHDIPTNGYVKNVPYGIWFANETITLTKDNYTKYAPSWSLMIGTQFKPFPNSSYLFSDVSSGSSVAPFATMAQIMQKQSYIYEAIENNMASLDTIKESVEKNVDMITDSLAYITSLVDSVKMQSTENITYLIDQRIKEISNSTSIISYNIKWQTK